MILPKRLGEEIVVAYGRQLVIVDVQVTFPTSEKLIEPLLDYIKGFQDIIYIYDTLNNDSPVHYDMFKKLKDSGVHVRFKKIEKQYAFIRDLMGTKFSDNDIIALLKYMIKHNVWDTRNIEFNKDWEKFLKKYPKFKDNFDNYPAYIPEDLYEQLKTMVKPRPIVVGGGKNECLKEIVLLLEALNKNPETNFNFTY